MTERFKTLTEAEMTPEQKRLVQAIIAGPRKQMRGGPFQALLRSPELGDIVQQFGAHVRFKSTLPDALKEFAILVTARHWTAQYEWVAHRRMGREAGLDPAKVEALAERQAAASMSAEETAIYEFATELLRTGEVSDANFAAVKERWGERGVVDLILTVGLLHDGVDDPQRAPPPRSRRTPSRSQRWGREGNPTRTRWKGYFAILKRGIIGTYHHVSEEHLHRYLAEFSFRYSERKALGVEDRERATKALRGIVGKRLIYRRTDSERPEAQPH